MYLNAGTHFTQYDQFKEVAVHCAIQDQLPWRNTYSYHKRVCVCVCMYIFLSLKSTRGLLLVNMISRSSTCSWINIQEQYFNQPITFEVDLLFQVYSLCQV